MLHIAGMTCIGTNSDMLSFSILLLYSLLAITNPALPHTDDQRPQDVCGCCGWHTRARWPSSSLSPPVIPLKVSLFSERRGHNFRVSKGTNLWAVWASLQVVFWWGGGLSINRGAKETQMYRTVFWTLGEGEGGMIWENGIETCILSYVKWITSPGSMHETGCLGLVHWDDPEGWDGGSGWGTHVRPWLIHVNVWQKSLQYCN